MRVVYGAGAVAVVSVIAVGLVQPEFTASADPATDTTTADSNATDATYTQNQDGSSSNGNQSRSQPNHVVKYIHLKPGQTAPPGAKVIQPNQPTPRVVVTTKHAPASNPPAANGPTATHKPNPTTAPPPPVHQPTPPPPARPPTPRPTAKTHQSGHP